MLLRVVALCVAVVGSGCAKKAPVPRPQHGASWSEVRSELGESGIGVAPVVFAADLPAPAMALLTDPDAVSRLQEDEHGPPPTILDPANPRDAAFLRNDWVGNVRFGGGIVHVGAVGMDVRARLVELDQEAEWRAQAGAWVAGMLDAELARRGVPATDVQAFALPGPERQRYRGVHPEDGHDNVNLPRSTLKPAALDEAQRASARSAGAGKLVLVPIVRSYLTHNGGWFLGQTWGTMSGARAELLLVLYDVDSGEPVWWLATEAAEREGRASPGVAELDAALLAVEEATQRRLRKDLLR